MEVLGAEPTGSPRGSQNLNTFALLIVNSVCNFAHKDAEKSVGLIHV